MPIFRLPRIAAVFVLVLLGLPVSVFAQPSLRPLEGPPQDPGVRQAQAALQRFAAAAELRHLVVPDGPNPLSRLLSTLRLLDAQLAYPGAEASLRTALPGLQNPSEDTWRALRLEVYRALRIIETVGWADSRRESAVDTAPWSAGVRTRELQRAVGILERLAAWASGDESPNYLAASTVQAEGQAGVAVGSISGTVTDADSGEPIPFERVCFSDTSGSFHDTAFTASDGSFQIKLAAGEYFARTHTDFYFDEIYDGHQCGLSGCGWDVGNPIAVLPGEAVIGIEFALELGGSLTGIVTEEATAEPAYPSTVRLFRPDGFRVGLASLQQDGTYRLGSLPSGDYKVSVRNHDDLLGELFDDLPCPISCDVSPGISVEIFAGSETSGIDFALSPGGQIKGSMTHAATGAPVTSGLIHIHTTEGRQAFVSFLAEDGSYKSAGGVPSGNFFVTTELFANLVDELYDDFQCFPFVCDVTTGTPVAVTEGQVTVGIDFSVSEGGKITGTLTSTATGQLILDNVMIRLSDSAGVYITSEGSQSSGSFTFQGLPTGSYFARTDFARPFNAQLYVGQLYEAEPCFFGCDVTTGTAIPVSQGAVTSGIDFSLTPGGAITGSIGDSTLNAPVDRAFLSLFDADGLLVSRLYSGQSGTFSLMGLPEGVYFLATDTFPLFADEVFDDLPCSLTACNPLAADPISVVGGVSTDDLHFTLDPPGACGNGIADEVNLSNHTWTVPVTYEACDTLTLGNGTQIIAGGDVTLKAGQTVVLEDGFSVGVGGALTVVITPVLASTP